MTYNPDTNSLEGGEKDLTMHDGTVRDCCFVEEGSGGSTLLLSGGAGDCKVMYVLLRTELVYFRKNIIIMFYFVDWEFYLNYF